MCYNEHMNETKNTNSLGTTFGEGLKTRARVGDVERAQIQAYTAQPFMDRASELFDTLQSSPAFQDFSGQEIIEDRGSYGLESLVHYAAHKAELADKRGQRLELTHNERTMLDAYSAEASLIKVRTEYDDELFNFDPDEHVDYLQEVAFDNVRSAKTPQEKAYWRKMSKRLEDYSAHLRSEVTSEQWGDRNTTDAGYLLDSARLSNSDDVQDQEGISVQDVRYQTQKMNEQAEMFMFIGEVLREEQAKSVPETEKAEVNTGLTPAQIEAMRQQVANTRTRSDARSAETVTVPTVPEDWHKREDFLKQWFESHDTKTTPENLEVARQWITEEIKMGARKMRMARQANPGLRSARYNGNAAGMFGSMVGSEELGGINAVVARAYLEAHPDLKSLTNQDYARLKVRALAASLGLAVEDIEADYDSIFS